jgi:hypothetical protein
MERRFVAAAGKKSFTSVFKAFTSDNPNVPE